MDSQIDVFGKTVDDLVDLGKGCPSLEYEMRFQCGIGENAPENPADPEILFQDYRQNAGAGRSIKQRVAAIGGAQGRKTLVASRCRFDLHGFANSLKNGCIHTGA